MSDYTELRAGLRFHHGTSQNWANPVVMSVAERRRARQAVADPPSTFPRARLRKLLSFHPALVVIVAASAALFHEAMHTGLSGDVFYELAAGRWMLAHHAIIRRDVFTYSVPGRHWLDEEWGFQVLLAWLASHLGAASYWLVSAGASIAALLASVALWRHSGAGWLWAATLSVVAAVGLAVGLNPRPQDLSYFFFSLLLLFSSLARERFAWLVAVPPLLLVWANVHGSFLLGLAVLALEVAWSALPVPETREFAFRPLPTRPIALCAAVSLLATFANPNGPRLILYAIGVSTSPKLGAIVQEWQSPDFHSPLLLAAIAGPWLAMLAALALGKQALDLPAIVLASALFIAALHAVRFTPYFDLAACAAFARWQPMGREALQPNLGTAPAALLFAAALMASPHLPAGAVQASGPLRSPVAATDYLVHRSGRVFSTWWWSDYLDYRGVPVFLDGRTDMYFGTDVLATYLRVSQLETDPDHFFSRWRMRWVMWDTDSALSTYLSHDQRWTKVFSAQGAIVFEHKGRW
jgi:hypothetical protein